MTIQRAVPLAMLALVVVVLAVAFLPGCVRAWSFRKDLHRFVQLVKEGDPVAAAGYVADVDYERLVELIDESVPADYHQDLVSLNISSVEWDGASYRVRLVARFQGRHYSGIGQAKMRWLRTPRGWRVNLGEVQVAEGYPEGNFVDLEYYLGSPDLYE